MIAKGGHLLAGIVTPSKYYLAFRASDSASLSSDTLVNRGYLLAMARAHHAPTSIMPPNSILGFTLTPEMFKELKIPLYVGRRGQSKLNQSWK